VAADGARKRDYRAEHRRRNERARARGFANYWQQRNAPRQPRTLDQLRQFPEAARDARRDALGVVQLARDTGVSVEIAAAISGVPMDVVRWHAAPALKPTRGGVTRPTRSDRIARFRPLYIEGSDRVEFIVTRTSRDAKRAGEVFATQWGYQHGEATADEVRALAGMRFGKHRVEADPARLDRIGAIGEANPDEVYRELVA
jgi:hypothetical protein